MEVRRSAVFVFSGVSYTIFCSFYFRSMPSDSRSEFWHKFIFVLFTLTYTDSPSHSFSCNCYATLFRITSAFFKRFTVRNDGSLLGLHQLFSVAVFVTQPLDCLVQFYMFWSSRNVVILVGVLTYVLWLGMVHLPAAAQLVSFLVIVCVCLYMRMWLCVYQYVWACTCVGRYTQNAFCTTTHTWCVLCCVHKTWGHRQGQFGRLLTSWMVSVFSY